MFLLPKLLTSVPENICYGSYSMSNQAMALSISNLDKIRFIFRIFIANSKNNSYIAIGRQVGNS